MLGIIGGTGLYKVDGLENVKVKEVETPFGKPSARLICGTYEGTPVIFLPRHGNHHNLLPSDINYRANIWALKKLGARKIIGVSAVGSLRKDIKPGDISIPSQYFDWTKGIRQHTFFGNGIAAHISTANPVCDILTQDIRNAASKLKIHIHSDKTYACVEGPRLGTRAESLFLRGADCDLVGMTNVPEAFLAREAQLSYAAITIATDYDCWLDDPELHVSVDKVIAEYGKNLEKVKGLLKEIIRNPLSVSPDYCSKSLDGAILTCMENLTVKQTEIVTFLKS